MKKVLLTTLIIGFLSILNLSAQGYNTGIGLRGGLAQGVTIKHFLGKTSNAIEGILAFRWDGPFITGLYEIHDDPFKVDGLQWFYGFGAHIGFWEETKIGVDFILGLEYTFEEIPINVTLDWKPAINLVGDDYWLDGFALSVRYVF